MKLKTWIVILMFALTAVAHGATNDLTGLLQKGLFEEEANRDLDAAIANYQSLASAFDKDRQLAATAIFRLGECYRKLGKTNEAVAQYERIVHEFSDQQTLVTLSRQNLTGLGASNSAGKSGDVKNPSETLQQLQQLIIEAEAQFARNQTLLKTLQEMDRNDLQKALPGMVPDAQFDTLVSQLNQAQQDLVRLRNDYTTDNPRYKNAETIIKDLHDKIDDRVEGILIGLRAKLDSSKAYLDTLKAQIQTTLASEQKIAPQSGGSGNLDNLQSQYALLRAQLERARSETNNEIVAELFNDNKELAERLRMELSMIGPHEAMVRDAQSKGPAAVEGEEQNLKQTQARVEAARQQIFDYQEIRLKILESAIKEAQARNSTQTGSPRQDVSTTDDEEKEIRNIQAMIQNSPDLIDAPDNNGRTPLEIAAAKGQLIVAKYLLDHGANVNGRPQYQNNSPLYDAADNGHKAIVELLLQRGADVNALNPLYRAVLKGFSGVAEALLANKADPNLRGDDGQRALHLAVARGKIDLIPLLIQYGADVNATNDHGQTPLHQAAGPNEAKLLLASKAVIDARDQWGQTPLHLAAQGGKTDVVLLLIDSGANVNATNFNRDTPLSYAVSNKRVDATRVLLEHKADPNVRDSSGSPLFRATDPEIARLLIAHGAEVNARWKDGVTPLMHDVRESTELLNILLANGAQTDLPDTNGNTALHFAAFYSRPELVAALLEHRANPNLQNEQSFTALDIAKRGQTSWMPDSMLYAGSSLSHQISTDNENKIADMLAKAGGVANLPKRDRIQLQRGSDSRAVFSKGSHDWNHFSLIEFVAVQCGLLSTAPSGEWYMRPGDNSSLWQDTLGFPDLKKITIYRRTSDNARQTTSEVNLEDILATGDCSRDVGLEWGDVVEIPEADHPVDEKWEGLAASTINALTNCVARQVTIKIKGESTLLKLAPALVPIQVTVGDMLYSDRKKLIRPSFMLRSVLDNSKLIRVSSDLSHVKVTRRDPATKKTVEWIVDCTSPSENDLWLRDGDVIEVPEK